MALKLQKKIPEFAKPDDVDPIEANYLDFLKVLEDHLKSKSIKSLDSKDIIKDFLDRDIKTHNGVEITVHCICAAAIKISVESDVESLVSRYEKHFKAIRKLGEENAEQEIEISENGQKLIHADKILKKSMDEYWNSNGTGEWHFVHKNSEKTFVTSSVIDRRRKERSKLNFMEN